MFGFCFLFEASQLVIKIYIAVPHFLFAISRIRSHVGGNILYKMEKTYFLTEESNGQAVQKIQLSRATIGKMLTVDNLEEYDSEERKQLDRVKELMGI